METSLGHLRGWCTHCCINLIPVLLAWRGPESQPTPSEVALFALLAAGFQMCAAWAFNRMGRVDLTHAGSSLRRLVGLANRAERATNNAGIAREKGLPVATVRDSMNQLSVELSVLQEGFVEVANDWTDSLLELLADQTKKTPKQEDR